MQIRTSHDCWQRSVISCWCAYDARSRHQFILITRLRRRQGVGLSLHFGKDLVVNHDMYSACSQPFSTATIFYFDYFVIISHAFQIRMKEPEGWLCWNTILLRRLETIKVTLKAKTYWGNWRNRKMCAVEIPFFFSPSNMYCFLTLLCCCSYNLTSLSCSPSECKSNYAICRALHHSNIYVY